MIRDLLNRALAVAVAAAAAFVAVIALGATVYYALLLVLVPLAAAALTAGLFALVAFIALFVFARKASGDDEQDDEDAEPEGIPARLLHMVQQRPVIGIVAALATGAVILKKPGLAALALTAFNESRGSSSSSSSKNRKTTRRRR